MWTRDCGGLSRHHPRSGQKFYHRDFLVTDRIVWNPSDYCKAKLDVKLRGLKVMRSKIWLHPRLIASASTASTNRVPYPCFCNSGGTNRWLMKQVFAHVQP